MCTRTCAFLQAAFSVLFGVVGTMLEGLFVWIAPSNYDERRRLRMYLVCVFSCQVFRARGVRV